MGTKEYQAEYNRRPDVRQRYKDYLNSDIRISLIHHAKARSKKLGLDFDISREDITIPTHCPILGIKLLKGEGRLSANSPTLDRVDNLKGYIKGNVRIISHKANSLKREHTLETLDRLIQYIKGEI